MPPAETTEASEFGPSMTEGRSTAFLPTVRVALSATVPMAQALRYDKHEEGMWKFKMVLVCSYHYMACSVAWKNFLLQTKRTAYCRVFIQGGVTPTSTDEIRISQMDVWAVMTISVQRNTVPHSRRRTLCAGGLWGWHGKVRCFEIRDLPRAQLRKLISKTRGEGNVVTDAFSSEEIPNYI